MKTTPGIWVYLGCYLRAQLAGVAYNSHGLQNIGFFYAIDPALRALYRDDPAALLKARLRYAGYYTCHPFFTPLMLGFFLRTEAFIAEGRIEPDDTGLWKNTASHSLSAIGDSFFTGTLFCAWSLAASCFVLSGQPLAALWLIAVIVIMRQLLKLTTFFLGLHRNMPVLKLIGELDLPTWSERFRYGNAGLLGCMLWLALPDFTAGAWTVAVVVLLAMGWFVCRRHVPRIFTALVLLTLADTSHRFAGELDWLSPF